MRRATRQLRLTKSYASATSITLAAAACVTALAATIAKVQNSMLLRTARWACRDVEASRAGPQATPSSLYLSVPDLVLPILAK